MTSQDNGTLNHDAAFKKIFSHPQIVRDLIEGFIHEDWVKDIDFSTLRKANIAYTAADNRQRFNDTVWQVQFRGSSLYICVLLEFQSTIDKYMAVRLMSYVGLLYEDLIHAKMLPANSTLPPVLPIVLYNGRRKWRAATSIQDLMPDLPQSLQKWQPQLKYFLLDESHHNPEQLKELHNLVNALIKVEYTRQKPENVWNDIEQLYQEVETTLNQKVTDKQERNIILEHIIGWLVISTGLAKTPAGVKMIVNQLKETPIMLQDRVREWEKGVLQRGVQQGVQEGRQEGRLEGRLEGQVAVLKNLLITRFGSMPSWAEKRLQNANDADIEKWTKRLFEADSYDTLFA